MKPSRPKLLYLQGLRGLAILAVVLFHFFPKHFSNGYLGVDMFFLLSGFLMAMMVNNKNLWNPIEVIDFWYRRVKRIVPLYYLLVLLTIVFLRFTEISLRSANFQSAIVAVLFATNLVRPSEDEGYFEKLGVAMDMFTHTWSLALEMQFYLIFPLIFLLIKSVPTRFSYFSIFLLSCMSFIFHCFADSFISFNSMFARIWQFNCGPSRSDVVNYCLMAVFALFVSPTLVTPLFARLNITILTMAILQHGSFNFILENKCLVFVGEISYAWYLVHWPIVAYIRQSQIEMIGEIAALLATFAIAVCLHMIIELRYLKWEKLTSIAFVAVLLLASGSELISLKESIYNNQFSTVQIENIERNATGENAKIGLYNYPSDFLGKMVYGYENKTAEERIKLNEYYEATDVKQSMNWYCKKFKKVKTRGESRCELNEGVNKNSTMKLLVVGNSWAGNIVRTLASECRHKFSHLEISMTSACESLVHTQLKGFNCAHDHIFLDAIKEIKPDVLFIIERHISLMDILNGTNPFDDENFKTAAKRLAEMQKHVSKRIFILDAFPELSQSISKSMNQHLKNNAELNDSKLAWMSQKYLTARVRLARLAENCPKCRLFDYAPQLFTDGQFSVYDRKYFVSYFPAGLHLTPPAMERVRPLFRQMCDSV